MKKNETTIVRRTIQIPLSLDRAIEDVRAKERPIPSRSEMMVRLLEKALEKEKKAIR